MNEVILLSQVPFGRLADVNRLACHQLGYRREELLALSIYDLVDQATARLLSERFFSGPGSMEDREDVTGSLRNHQGETIPMEMNLCRIHVPGSTYVLLTARDIKRVKTTEETLLDSEVRHRMIISAAFDGVVTMNSQGLIIGWNPQAEKIFGWSTQEVAGTLLADKIIPASQREAHRQGLAHYLASGEGPVLNRRMELNAWHRDGYEFPVELTITPLKVANETIFNAFVRDITAQKQSEAELKKAHEELERRVKERTAELSEANRQLLLTEAKYRTLVEQLPAVTYVADLAGGGQTTYISPQVETILGFKPAEWQADSGMWFKQLHLEDRDRIIQEIREKNISGEPFNLEYRALSRQGQVIWFRNQGVYLRDESGNPRFVHGVMLDITKRKQAEAELSQARQRYADLVDKLNVGIYRNTPGPEGRFLEINPTMVSIFEADSAEQLLKQKVSGLYQDPSQRQAFSEKMMKLGFVRDEKVAMKTLKGKSFWGAITAVKREDQEGHAYFYGIVEDISERIRVEEQLRLQATALEAAANAIVISDPDGVVLWVNQAYTALTGYSFLEAVGQSTRLLRSGKQPPDFYSILWQTIRSGRVWHGEIINRRKDGQLYTEDMTITPVHDAQGRIANYIAIKQDITVQKHAEEEIRNTQVFLDSIVENIPDMIFVKDAGELRFVQLNKAGEELLGHLRGDLIGKNDFDFFPPEEANFFTVKDREVLGKGKVIDIPEEPIHTQHKGVRILHTKKVPVLDTQGKPQYLLGISEDITEQLRAKKMESALYRISATAGAGGDTASFYKSIHEILSDLIYARNLYIALYDPATEVVTFPYFVDEKDPAAQPRKLSRGLTDHVLLKGQALWIGRAGTLDALRQEGFSPVGTTPVDWIGVPLKIEGRTIGVLAVQSYEPQISYSEKDIELLTYVSQQIAVAIDRKQAQMALSAYTAQLQAKNTQMADDLSMAREIQQALLPQRYPSFPAAAAPEDSILRFHHLYYPSGAVGGDFFDVLALSETRAGVFICDVMGHGMRAALITAILRGLTEELTLVAHDPGAYLTELNRDFLGIFGYSQRELFATAFYLVVDIATGLLLYANAGHPSPLHVHRKTGRVDLLGVAPGAAGPALGLKDDVEYSTHQCPIDAGELVVLFTDGLCEVEGPDRHSYGEDRLRHAVEQRSQLKSQELFQELLTEVRQFSGGQGFPDDVCMLGMELVRLLQPEDRQ